MAILIEVSSGSTNQPERGFEDTNMSAGTAALNQIASSIETIDGSGLRKNIEDFINEMAGVFKPRPDGPKSCEISFNIKVSAEGSLIVSKLAAESNIQVTVVWER